MGAAAAGAHSCSWCQGGGLLPPGCGHRCSGELCGDDRGGCTAAAPAPAICRLPAAAQAARVLLPGADCLRACACRRAHGLVAGMCRVLAGCVGCTHSDPANLLSLRQAACGWWLNSQHLRIASQSCSCLAMPPAKPTPAPLQWVSTKSMVCTNAQVIQPHHEHLSATCTGRQLLAGSCVISSQDASAAGSCCQPAALRAPPAPELSAPCASESPTAVPADTMGALVVRTTAGLIELSSAVWGVPRPAGGSCV